jgi:DNA-binding NtrC family response regulator
MPRETLSSERAQELEKALSAPKEIVIDQSTARRLEELCSQMTDTCGLIEVTLQLAIQDVSDKRDAYMKTALSLAARGTKAIKMFLCEWGVSVEESKRRENSGQSAKDLELAPILNSITALGPTTESKLQPLAETERRAVINAMQQTGGDKIAASRILRIGRTTLYRKLEEFNLTGMEFREGG